METKNDKCKRPMMDESVTRVQAAAKSCVPGYVVMDQFDRRRVTPDEKVYLGREERYDSKGNYDNSDGSAIYVSNNGKMFNFLDDSPGWTISQQEMLREGMFTEADYAEYARVLEELSKKFTDIRIKRFSVRSSEEDSGLPFRVEKE